MSSSLNMPTEFGLSFFFRIAPGFLAAFLFLDTIGELNAVSLTDAITLVGILGLVLGLVLMLIRYPVWAFYEGRWFWPSRIREKMVSSLQKHLESSFMKAKSLQKKVDELSTKERLTADERKELDEARRKYKELWFGIRQFPEDRTGTWDVAPGIRVGMRKATAPTPRVATEKVSQSCASQRTGELRTYQVSLRRSFGKSREKRLSVRPFSCGWSCPPAAVGAPAGDCSKVAISSLRRRPYVALPLYKGACVASLRLRSDARTLLPSEMVTTRRTISEILLHKLSPFVER